MIARAVRAGVLSAVAHAPVQPVDAARHEVVLIRPDHLGDLLFVTPALRRLRQSLPDWRIVLAIGPWAADVVAGSPDVDEIVVIDYPGFTRRPKPSLGQPYALLAREARLLRERAPAAAVALRDDHWWGALLAQRAGIPARFGHDHPATSAFLSDPIAVDDGHWVRRNADLLDAVAARLGGTVAETPAGPGTDSLRWDVTTDACASANALLGEHGVVGPYLVIHPGSGAPVKLWPTERWAEVADACAKGSRIVLTGSAGERDLIERIRSAAGERTVSLAGQTNLSTLAALFAGATVVAGVDSGPLHLAVAVDVPTVHLYGPSDVARFGPWGDPARHRVVSAGMHCPACGDLSPGRPEGAGCMMAIDTETVIATIREVAAGG